MGNCLQSSVTQADIADIKMHLMESNRQKRNIIELIGLNNKSIKEYLEMSGNSDKLNKIEEMLKKIEELLGDTAKDICHEIRNQ
jgi:predicted transcriptional regulator